MTSANETQPRTTALTRRDARAMATRQAAARAPRLSRPRRALNAFAGLAAFGFLAAYLVPAGAALAEAAPTSNFENVTADAQAYVAAADAPRAEADAPRYGTYEVYVKPKPKPKPKPAPLADAATDSAASTGQTASTEAASWPTPFYTGGGSSAEWMAAAGIAESDWGYVDYIVSRESGWNPNATNASSGACGLVQALPCSKVPGSGYNPVDNLRWANGYAVGRYGSWGNAYAFWTANHWW